MLKLGITGGIASGKTTVCQILREQGAYVVSADGIGHRLLSTPCIKEKVTSLFGSSILTDDDIDREKLAKIVFADMAKLKALEELLHPPIFREIREQFESASADENSPYFVVEVPLLFETGFDNFFDQTWNIESNQSSERTRLQPDDFANRTKRFFSDVTRNEKATNTIINNKTKEELKENVLRLLPTLRQQ